MHHTKRLFSHDPVSKITTWWHDNDENDEVILHKEQDITELLEDNKASFDSYSGPDAKWGDWAQVARLPTILHAELAASGKLYDKAYMTRMLNSTEWRQYRTRPGRVDIRLEK
jgi:hypothetical protein